MDIYAKKTDRDLLILLVERQEKQDNRIDHLEKQMETIILRDPFYPPKGENGHSLISRVQRLETRWSNTLWFLAGLGGIQGIQVAFSIWKVWQGG